MFQYCYWYQVAMTACIVEMFLFWFIWLLFFQSLGWRHDSLLHQGVWFHIIIRCLQVSYFWPLFVEPFYLSCHVLSPGRLSFKRWGFSLEITPNRCYHACIIGYKPWWVIKSTRLWQREGGGGGGNRGVNLPSPYFLSQFLPPPYFFEPISPSSLNGYVSFSPSPYFSPLFLPPPYSVPPPSTWHNVCRVHNGCEETDLRKADRTGGVNCYIFSTILSGTTSSGNVYSWEKTLQFKQPR